MNTSNKNLAVRLRRVESRNVTFISAGFPVFWESAKASTVRDAEGRCYTDLTAAFAVCSLGHGAPAVRRAILSQTRHLWHGMGDVHPSKIKVELLEALAHLAPGELGVSILSSSGAEAVESAMKTARLATGKARVIAFRGAYHGLSYGTLAVTDREECKTPFADQLASIADHLPFPDPLRGARDEECLERVEKALKKCAIGAIVFEPVQGRGGVRVASPVFMRGLRDISKRHGLLLIADEVMTGFGRTGRTFAVDHAGIVPDLLCVGKALANGFPMSACIGTPKVMSAWPLSDGEAIHTSTFLGNPLGCAMALASLKELQSRRLAARAAALGSWWLDELQAALGAHPRVGDIRGLGLMIGIELVKDKQSLLPDSRWTARMVSACLEKGLMVLSGGVWRNVLTLTPPLTISKTDLERSTRLLKEALNGTP